MTRTALVVTSLIIFLGIFDLCVVVFSPGDHVQYSVSRFLQPLRKYPFIVFVFGYIAGHVWGFMTPDCELQRRVMQTAGIGKALKKIGLRRNDGCEVQGKEGTDFSG